jgi:PAS domain S-box-containing protein
VPLALLAFIGFLVALVPAALVQAQLETEARRERSEQIGDQARRLASAFGRQMDNILEGARQTLRTMAAHDAVRALRPGTECDLFLARVVSASPRYATANLFDRSGDPICMAQSTLAGINVADRAYFVSALSGMGGLHVGEHAVGRATREASLHLAAPMLDDTGRVGGVLVVALSLAWLNEELGGIMLPPGGAALVADRAGVVLARTPAPERFVGSRMPPFAIALLDRPAPGLFEGPALDGVRRIAAYIPVDAAPQGLFVSVGLEVERALAAAVEADRRATLMILGSLLLTFLVWLLSFNAAVERPVGRMLAVAQHWGRRDWQARIGQVRGGREFRQLGAALDSMAEAVRTSELDRRRMVTRMAAVLRVAPQIVMTADPDGKVDWVNWYWEELTGLDLRSSRGDGWLKVVHEGDREQFESAWTSSVAGARERGEEDFSRELRLCRTADDTWRWFVLRGAAIRDGSGGVSSWAMVGIDVHDLRQSQAEAQRTASQLRATYENTPVGLCLLDRGMRFLAINEMLAATNGSPAAKHLGRTLSEMAPHVAPTLEPALRRVIETGQPIIDMEVEGEFDGEQRAWLCSYHAVRGPDGEVTALSGAVLDITARKRIEHSERLLSREVDHRAQNALAVVRGLIRLSAADAPDDVPALVELLEGRIAAMSRAHTLLARDRWVGAELGELVRQEVEAHARRVDAEGPELRLQASVAQPLTLVLHELLTNAVKYGALSAPDGRLLIRWEQSGDGASLSWTERGGPPVEAPPARQGFGTLLIDANVQGQLAGDIARHWDREGLRAVITIGGQALGPADAAGLRRTGSRLDGRSVLLVPDDALDTAPLALVLRGAGCRVLGPAESLDHAIALAETAGSVDVAVLGAMLDGRSLQALHPLLERRSSAVVLLAAEERQGDDAAAIRLAPPFTGGRVRSALIRAMAAARQSAR